MLISELMEELRLIESEHGDIEVRANCDHGQQCMSVFSTSIMYIEDSDSSMPEYSSEPEDDYIKVVEIQA